MNDSSATPAAPATRLPFYTGQPVALSGRQWAWVLMMVVLGFVALVAPIAFFKGEWQQFLPALLFCGLPLLGLAMATPGHWTAIFGPVGWREIGWMIGIAVLNIVVSVGVGFLVTQLSAVSQNPVFGMLAVQPVGSRVLFFARTLPQLLGEELLTVLPLLAMASFLHLRLKWSRFWSLALAWVLSALWFGLVHLPTYDWNFLQCVVIIGSARLVLSLAFLKTGNLWVSTGAHVINDWTMFLGVMLLGGMAAHGAG